MKTCQDKKAERLQKDENEPRESSFHYTCWGKTISHEQAVTSELYGSIRLFGQKSVFHVTMAVTLVTPGSRPLHILENWG